MAAEDIHAVLVAANERLRPFAHPTMRMAMQIYARAPEGAETVPATELFAAKSHRPYATAAIADLTPNPETEDPRVAVVRLVKRYTATLVTGMMVSLAHGIAIDLSVPRIRIATASHQVLGILATFDGPTARISPERPTDWPVTAPAVATLHELRDRAFRSLLEEALAPMFELLLSHVRVSRRVLWCTVAEFVELVCNNLIAAQLADPGILKADRAALLGTERLSGQLWWEMDQARGHEYAVRDVCCMQFLLSNRVVRPDARYCATCGLATPEQRSAKRGLRPGERAITRSA